MTNGYDPADTGGEELLTIMTEKSSVLIIIRRISLPRMISMVSKSRRCLHVVANTDISFLRRLVIK